MHFLLCCAASLILSLVTGHAWEQWLCENSATAILVLRETPLRQAAMLVYVPLLTGLEAKTVVQRIKEYDPANCSAHECFVWS